MPGPPTTSTPTGSMAPVTMALVDRVVLRLRVRTRRGSWPARIASSTPVIEASRLSGRVGALAAATSRVESMSTASVWVPPISMPMRMGLLA